MCSHAPNGSLCQELLSQGEKRDRVVSFHPLPGLQHEGIFRVPGSQAQVAEIRNAFEKGEWRWIKVTVTGCTEGGENGEKRKP